MVEEIEGLLRNVERPLSASEIAEELGVDRVEVSDLMWQTPERFVWQPGHKWHLVQVKARQTQPALHEGLPNVQPRAFVAPETPAMFAALIDGGVEFVVRRRVMDSAALFTVREQGNQLELLINSGHEALEDLPMPFDEGANAADPGYKVLLELMLEAWALNENKLVSERERTEARELRQGWGRKLSELVDELGA